MNRHATFIPILAYHGLERGEARNGLYTLRESQFEAQMRFLAENGFRTISLSELMAWTRGETLPAKSIVITFDDGLGSDEEITFPILKQFGFTATFFVNPGTLGQKGYLTVAQLKTLSRGGMEIGSHGFDHLFLTRLSKKDLEHQVTASKGALESQLGREISFFAVPRGRYNAGILSVVKKAGYVGSCTSDAGFNRRNSDPFRLKRWAIKRSYELRDFESVVKGRPAAPLVAEYVIKQSAYRVLGHSLYETVRSRAAKEEQ